MKVKSESEVTQSCPTLRDPMTVAHQAPLPMGFSRREYWSGLPSPSPNVMHILPNISLITSVSVNSSYVIDAFKNKLQTSVTPP